MRRWAGESRVCDELQIKWTVMKLAWYLHEENPPHISRDTLVCNQTEYVFSYSFARCTDGTLRSGEESSTGPGSLFHLGFFSNLHFQSLLSLANLRVQVSSEDSDTATVRVSYQDTQVTEEVALGETVSIPVDSDMRVRNIQERDKAVVVESVGGQGVSVVAFSEEITSGDSYCVLPCIFLPSLYENYVVSVPRTQLMELVDGELEPVAACKRSAFLIVSSEDSTVINLTLTQTVQTEGAADLQQFGSSIRRGETVSLTLDAAKTLYVSSLEDLTGSRVVSNKPLTFLSGHECGTIPQPSVCVPLQM